ncbi:MAG: hypothetical protein LUG61_11200 [Lachnospiraceae bacterium]|nr:hypothetical protein [Lachnospiraceae bacterium]
MADFSKAITTVKGQELMTKLLAGEVSQIEFTNVSLSSTVYDEGDLENLEALDGIEQTSAVSMITREDNTTVQVEASFSNTELKTGYYIHSLGVYASDPDDGEILFAAAVETSGTSQMTAYSGISVSGAYVKIALTVSNSESVSITVSSAASASVGDMQNMQSKIETLESTIPALSYDEASKTLIFELADTSE